MAGFGAKVDMVRTHASSAAPTAPLRPSLCSAVPALPDPPVGGVPDPIERARGCSQLDLAGARGEGAEGFPAGRPLPDLRPEPECAPPPRFARCSPAPVHSLPPLPRAEESRSLPLLSLSPSWPSAAESRREPLSCTPLSRPPGRALPRAEESRSLPLLSPALSRSLPLTAVCPAQLRP